MVRAVVSAAAIVALAACGSDGDAPADAHGHDDGEAPGAVCADLEPIGEFGEVLVTVGGEQRCLLLAQTPEQRARGLMEVTDLGGYPGMAFAFPADTDVGFWMRNTPTPLSIAYLDASGAIVSTADMAPCDDVPTCPTYPAAGPYRWAVEVPQGNLDDLGLTGDARLTIESEVHPS